MLLISFLNRELARVGQYLLAESEHVGRVVDRLYANGICANMVASVVYLSDRLLARAHKQVRELDLTAAHRIRVAVLPSFEPSLRFDCLLFRTVRI